MARARSRQKTAAVPTGTRTDRAPKTRRKKAASSVETKLVGMADVVIQAAQRSRDPGFEIPVRALSNVSFNPRKGMIEMGSRKQERTFFNVGMAKKFMQTMLVADALAELQRADLTTSLREIYYRTKHTIQNSQENTFDTQDESDPIIEDLEVSLSELREELHVRAENGGSVVGPWCWAMTATAWTARGSARAATPSRPSSSPSTSRSRSAPPISCWWSRRAPSGTGSPRTSSGGRTTASC